MKFYAIAMLMAAVSADQAELDRIKQNLVDGINSGESQEAADQNGLAAEEKRLRDIENNNAWERKVKIQVNPNEIE